MSPLIGLAMVLIGIGVLGLAVAAVAYMIDKIWTRFDARKNAPAKNIHKIGAVFWDDGQDRMVIKPSSIRTQALLTDRTAGREAKFSGTPAVQEPIKSFELFPDYGQTIPEIALPPPGLPPSGIPRGLPLPRRNIDLDDTTETGPEIKLHTIDIAAIDPDKTPVRKWPGGGR